MRLSRLNEDKLPGGLADDKSVKDLAKHHGVSADKIVDQLNKGIEVELEHTHDHEVAKEVAMDHIYEDPNYYNNLEKIHEGLHSDHGYPNSGTGGTRTSIGKVMPDEEDYEEETTDLLDSNMPNDTPGELEDSNTVQPILKEPADWLKPKWPVKGPDGA